MMLLQIDRKFFNVPAILKLYLKYLELYTSKINYTYYYSILFYIKNLIDEFDRSIVNTIDVFFIHSFVDQVFLHLVEMETTSSRVNIFFN